MDRLVGLSLADAADGWRSVGFSVTSDSGAGDGAQVIHLASMFAVTLRGGRDNRRTAWVWSVSDEVTELDGIPVVHSWRESHVPAECVASEQVCWSRPRSRTILELDLALSSCVNRTAPRRCREDVYQE